MAGQAVLPGKTPEMNPDRDKDCTDEPKMYLVQKVALRNVTVLLNTVT
jgi:hypothetical protein